MSKYKLNLLLKKTIYKNIRNNVSSPKYYSSPYSNAMYVCIYVYKFCHNVLFYNQLIVRKKL